VTSARSHDGRQSLVLRVALALLVLGFCTAPVPGDVGGCGQEPDELDAPVYFASKKGIDCERCRSCGLKSDYCTRACDRSSPIDRDFPEDCFPLVHDGEVCLRALLHASCDDYATYADDRQPAVPTECNFCPARGK
jgi:hypothetical protein